jgi:hypothetical protein
VTHPPRPLVWIGTAQLLRATVPVVPPVYRPNRRVSRVDHVFTVRAKWIIVKVQFRTPYTYQFPEAGTRCAPAEAAGLALTRMAAVEP